MIRTYKARALMSPYAHRRLDEVLARCCTLYNAALEERINAWKISEKSISYYDQTVNLTQIRKDDPEYQNISVHVLRSPLKRINMSFTRFFNRIKNNEKCGFPRFKSLDRYRSFEISDSQAIKSMIHGNKLRIKGLPEIKLKYNGDLPDKENLKQVSIIRKPVRIEVHLTYELPDVDLREVHNPVGIDMGVASLATLSTGEKIVKRKRNRKRLKRYQRMAARRRKGSNRRKKAVTMLRKEWQRVAEAELDYMHRTTADLIKRFDGFAVEDLDIKTMLKKGNGKLFYEIKNQRWGIFIRLLEYKAASAGFQFIKIDPRYTTQTCSRCGKIKKKQLWERKHNCDCGLKMDRDENAALNILARGFPSTRVGRAEMLPAQTLTY